MRVPKSIPVAGHKTKITWADLDGKWGDFDGDRYWVRLENELKKKGDAFTLEILVHELTHAGLSYAGLAEILGSDNEEAICRFNQHIMLPVLLKLLVDKR